MSEEVKQAESTPEKEQAGPKTALALALEEASKDYEDPNEVSPVKAPEEEPEQEASEDKDTELTSEDAPDEQAATSEDEAEEEAKPLEAPSDWSEGERERFSKLPKEAQELVLEQSKNLQAGFTRKTQEFAEQRKQFEPFIKSMTQQGRQMFEGLMQQGVTPEMAVQRSLHLQEQLKKDPKGSIRKLAAGMGVNLEDLVFGTDSDASAQQPAFDPQALVKQAEEAAYRRFQQGQQQSQQVAVRQQLSQVLEAKNDKGELVYPLLEGVTKETPVNEAFVRDFTKFLGVARDKHQGNVEAAVKDAYETAMWANPELRQQQIERERTNAVKAESERKRREAEKAKQAGKPMKPSTPTGTSPKKPRTVSEAIAQAQASLGVTD